MKKSSRHGGAQPTSPKSRAHEKEETKGSERNRKTYRLRLEDAGLTKAPVAPAVSRPTQKELVQIAATLGRNAPGNTGAGELVGRAMEIWKATNNALFIEEMANFLVKGLCIFNEADWITHCDSLVRSLDDARGTVPGQSTGEITEESARQARLKAGEAVAHVWRLEKRGESVLRALFPGKGETAESRSKRLLALLNFAQKRMREYDETHRSMGRFTRVFSLLDIWRPLGLPDPDGSFVDLLADDWMSNPERVEASNLGASAVLARWLTVMRMEQASEAKMRH